MLNNTQIFGTFIREMRRLKKVTQGELSKATGLSIDTIGRLERNQFSASIRTAEKICYALGTTFTIKDSEKEDSGFKMQLETMVKVIPDEITEVLVHMFKGLIEQYVINEEEKNND